MLLLDAINGKQIPRAPSVPKIYVDLAANLLNLDYIDIFNNPDLAVSSVIKAALQCQCDGARVFLFPKRDIRKEGDLYFHYKNGKKLGQVDIQGGFSTIYDDPRDIDFSDPETMICHNFFNSKTPIVTNSADLKKFKIPSIKDYNDLFGTHVDKAIKAAGDSCCPIGWAGNGTLQFCIYMLGMEDAMLSLYSDPALINGLMDIITEIIIIQAKFFIDRGIRVLRLGDSAANMKVISPKMWRAFIKPQFITICKAIHAYCPEAKIYCHICGDVRPVIPDIIESGVDCIACLDPLGNVTVAEARRIAGNNYMLMGGVDTLSFINKTPEEIVLEAERCIRDGLADNKYYALGSGCVVPRAAKPEALKALAIASHNLETPL
jgi:uroporphyrinogen-III decarboxylase